MVKISIHLNQELRKNWNLVDFNVVFIKFPLNISTMETNIKRGHEQLSWIEHRVLTLVIKDVVVFQFISVKLILLWRPAYVELIQKIHWYT